jgi:hypothetical protein
MPEGILSLMVAHGFYLRNFYSNKPWIPQNPTAGTAQK